MKLTTQPKIVFFDIDDTLWQKNQQYIPESTQIALKKLHQKGILTAIATGRTLGVLPEPIRKLAQDCQMDLFVTVNGQYVEYQGESLVSVPLDKNVIEQVKNILQQNQVAYACVARDGVWASQDDGRLRLATGDLGIPFRIDPNYHQNHDVYQLLAFFPAEMDNVILPQMPEVLRPIRWHENGIDLLEKQGSKAKGIQAALDKLGLKMDEAMAFGDALNDLEMLQAVGLGVAMGNAAPELKAVADYVTCDIDDDGIFKALKYFEIID